MATQVEQIDFKSIENMLRQIQIAQQEQAEKAKRIPIKTIQEARVRIGRLNNLFSDTNFDLLWKDRVTAVIGISPDVLRMQLADYRVQHFTGKYSASWYECINMNATYRDAAIKAVYELESEYHISGSVYREGEMTYAQQKEFDMISVPGLDDELFQKWYERRCEEFQSIGGKFNRALGIGGPEYKTRIYSKKYYRCADEFFSKADETVFNCLDATPLYNIPRVTIREYMIIVARSCLVL